MSLQPDTRRLTVPELAAMKGRQKIVALTAYSTPIARLIDPLVDFILVGDSTAMVAYGRRSTLFMRLDETISHTRAVVDCTQHACVIADMPFGSYQESPEQALRSCARVLAETGCDAVKLESNRALAATVAFLVERGIPVMAHVGLMPQFVNVLGGYKAQGLTEESAATIHADARANLAAGAFSLLLEGVAEPLARRISEESRQPCIGIGASPACDGQILVTEDLLGLSGPRKAKFVKQYADVSTVIRLACARYANEVRQGEFPEREHCYGS
ncbi:3-methyl-2-oxobutanoate hydroxymethyltransferase [Pseudomonas sp. WC1]|uniref:3-methyl-2-oxobutanoate hydroxymethyltransferase n=1 Tax=unclassified Pseudomonas TaxID=196821 RepID=UPI00111B1B7B|nr:MULTISPECIES: 3-methyl-2-oxobutanoate hydroxymethyltransferase [unclassified Pseudomonas]UVL17092.1 3-methyl-2-oxobutanoate hydroxymethyltransferase [Pseudomonas sp. B21-044]